MKERIKILGKGEMNRGIADKHVCLELCLLSGNDNLCLCVPCFLGDRLMDSF